MAPATVPPRSPFVRPLERGDLGAVVALRQALAAETRGGGDAAPDDEDRRRLVSGTTAALDRDHVVVHVADDPDGAKTTGAPRALVGFAVGRDVVWPPVWRTRRVGEIPDLFVLPSHRRRGLGRALLGAVSDDLARLGAEVLRGRALAPDAAARACYEALGFEPLMRTFSKPVGEPSPTTAAPVRPAASGDVPSLVLLHVAMLEENGRLEPRLEPHPEVRANAAAEWPRRLADPAHVVLVAEERPGFVVGFAAGRVEGGDGGRAARVGTVTDCFVLPSRRRRGLARTLASRLADALTRLEVGELRLHVVAKNAAALAFWGSLGYRPVEELLERPANAGR